MGNDIEERALYNAVERLEEKAKEEPAKGGEGTVVVRWWYDSKIIMPDLENNESAGKSHAEPQTAPSLGADHPMPTRQAFIWVDSKRI